MDNNANRVFSSTFCDRCEHSGSDCNVELCLWNHYRHNKHRNTEGEVSRPSYDNSELQSDLLAEQQEQMG